MTNKETEAPLIGHSNNGNVLFFQKALKNFPDHHDSQELLKQLKKHFSLI